MVREQSFHQKVGVSLLKWIVASIAVVVTATTTVAYISNQFSNIESTRLELKEFKQYQTKKDKEQDKFIKESSDNIIAIKSDLKYIIKLLEKK